MRTWLRTQLRTEVRNPAKGSTTPTRLYRLSVFAACAIAGLAYALSYASLYDLASHHNFAGPANWESIAWPFTVDLASFATGVIALHQAERGERSRLAGLVSLVSAGVMEAGNLLANASYPHWLDGWITVAMHAWPPAIALAGWWLVVHVRRSDSQSSQRPSHDSQSSQSDSQEPSQPANEVRKPANPGANGSANGAMGANVLRIAREGGTWRDVAEAANLQEFAAKRALTAAKKRIAANGSHS